MNRQPNILYLYSDEHSFRCLGHRPPEAGGEPVTTPTLDRLAAEGTVFTDAYCQMPLCTPSRLSMLTGKEVRKSGAWSNCSVLRPELETMPKVLGRAGYATALVGKMHLGGNQQFVGFQHRPYGDLTGQAGHQWEPLGDAGRKSMRGRTATSVGVTEIPESLLQDQVVCHEAVAFLREHEAASPDQPWFLTLGFSRPHFPLTAPRRYFDRWWPTGVTEPKIGPTGDAYDHPMSEGMRQGFQAEAIDHDEMMRARAGYFACVEYLDEVLGDLFLRLQASGLLENTVIVYTADHGELMGEHGVWWKNGWYEGCTRVPLIVSTPEQRRGEIPAGVCTTPVGLYDLMPTFCALAGAAAPADVDGVDLSPALRGGALDLDRPVLCDALTPRWGAGTEFRSIRYGQYKYVRFRDCEPLMFDLAADPEEQVNLLARDLDGAAAEAKAFLERFAAESIDFDVAQRERTERDGGLHEEYAQKLQSCGGNLYLMPSGTLVDADAILYTPRVVAASPAEAFGDYPAPPTS